MYNQLIESLKKSGISYTRLARLIGMPPSTMHDKIHGLTSFTLEEAVKIREALDVKMTVEELFKGGRKQNGS